MADRNTTFRFEQLDGPQTILELSGAAAPHGRPYLGAVVEQEIVVGKEIVYPAGAPPNAEPTIHIYGATPGPWVLRGRWTDRLLGKGVALAKRDEVAAFTNARRMVRVIWGDICWCVGLISYFKASVEGARDVEWTMTIDTVQDSILSGSVPSFRQAAEPDGLSSQLKTLIALLKSQLGDLEDLGSLGGNPLEILNSASGELDQLSTSIKSSVDATTGQLNTFAASMATINRALGSIEASVDSIGSGVEASVDLTKRATSTQISRSSTQSQIAKMLAAVAENQRRVSVEQRNRRVKQQEDDSVKFRPKPPSEQ